MAVALSGSAFQSDRHLRKLYGTCFYSDSCSEDTVKLSSTLTWAARRLLQELGPLSRRELRGLTVLPSVPPLWWELSNITGAMANDERLKDFMYRAFSSIIHTLEICSSLHEVVVGVHGGTLIALLRYGELVGSVAGFSDHVDNDIDFYALVRSLSQWEKFAQCVQEHCERMRPRGWFNEFPSCRRAGEDIIICNHLAGDHHEADPYSIVQIEIDRVYAVFDLSGAQIGFRSDLKRIGDEQQYAISDLLPSSKCRAYEFSVPCPNRFGGSWRVQYGSNAAIPMISHQRSFYILENHEFERAESAHQAAVISDLARMSQALNASGYSSYPRGSFLQHRLPTSFNSCILNHNKSVIAQKRSDPLRMFFIRFNIFFAFTICMRVLQVPQRYSHRFLCDDALNAQYCRFVMNLWLQQVCIEMSAVKSRSVAYLSENLVEHAAHAVTNLGQSGVRTFCMGAISTGKASAILE